ncbi:hypothetical protein F4780DRAFT_780319 [Xylariomycetidae sp. FL0641]|nr:hypothetical protein F4780DRAFT_780319 [Xylariomycetidae sp. FL0641]
MAPSSKTNFKTYEASTRLLAAVIATNPKLKLDFKELAQHIGGGTTKDSINHRLRPIKKLAAMQAKSVESGADPGDLPVEKGELAGLVGSGQTGSALEHRFRPIKKLAQKQLEFRSQGLDPGQLPVEGGEIARLFGESTPGGIEWQFRDIKALGRAQSDAVANGQPAAAVRLPGTPSSRSSVTAGTPRSGVRGGKRTPASARKRAAPPSDDDGAEDDDSDAPKPTPAKAAKRAKPTPTSALLIDVDEQGSHDAEEDDDDDDEFPSLDTRATARSIFGNGGAKKQQQPPEVIDLTPKKKKPQQIKRERPAPPGAADGGGEVNPLDRHWMPDPVAYKPLEEGEI